MRPALHIKWSNGGLCVRSRFGGTRGGLASLRRSISGGGGGCVWRAQSVYGSSGPNVRSSGSVSRRFTVGSSSLNTVPIPSDEGSFRQDGNRFSSRPGRVLTVPSGPVPGSVLDWDTSLSNAQISPRQGTSSHFLGLLQIWSAPFSSVLQPGSLILMPVHMLLGSGPRFLSLLLRQWLRAPFRSGAGAFGNLSTYTHTSPFQWESI